MRRTETQRIRTATNFLRRSAGSSEDTLHSSVTNVADFRVLQTSHSPLKIGGKTLSLSIAAKKCTVVAWQRRLQAAVDLTSRRCVFLNFCKGPWCFWGRNSAILVRNRKNMKIASKRWGLPFSIKNWNSIFNWNDPSHFNIFSITFQLILVVAIQINWILIEK